MRGLLLALLALAPATAFVPILAPTLAVVGVWREGARACVSYCVSKQGTLDASDMLTLV